MVKTGEPSQFKKKIGFTLNELLKKGSRYSQLAKAEIQLMILTSKKNSVYQDLGRYVHEKMKNKETDFTSDREFESFLTQLAGLEEEENSIQKTRQSMRKDLK